MLSPLHRRAAAAACAAALGAAPAVAHASSAERQLRAIADALQQMGHAIGATASPRVPRHVFPIRGPHQIGTIPDQRFGGARGHAGQDVFARCGRRVVVSRSGRVMRASYEAQAGNYVVIDGTDGRSYVYMHLRRPARVAEGDRVAAGQRLGRVGQTGDAFDCHLHFEVWTAPGWYQGGEAIDPYAVLRRWERAHGSGITR